MKALSNRSSGNDSLTTSSPSGPQPDKRSHSSLNKLTHTINQTIKFTAEVSETKTNFLDTTVYKGERFVNDRC